MDKITEIRIEEVKEHDRASKEMQGGQRHREEDKSDDDAERREGKGKAGKKGGPRKGRE